MIAEVSKRDRDQAPIDLLTPFFQGKPYHMPHSGYETVTSFIGRSRVYYVGDFPKITRMSYPLRFLRVMPKSYSSLQAELAALKGHGRILHHLYGEDTLFLSLFDQPKQRTMVATLHRPPEVLNATMPFFWRRNIRKLAGIVVLSPEQLAFIKSILGSANTHVSLIPHGIDTDYFTPGENKRSRDLVISVGHNLRDNKTLINALRTVSKKAPRLRLILISYTPLLKERTQNILPRVGMGDEEVLRYYREASFMVLSVTALTASNVMLEAMACGMPVICPRFESARYYMGEDIPTTYEPGNPDDLARRILWLHEEHDEREKLGSRMRERAQLFSWPRISTSLREFYDLVLEANGKSS